ncbi:hypothetical protein NKR19_g5133 [Coniochaeta hoffmannii]|uniref:Uncharacterized protein n=1 Tax=Coniochaeta hoffmannii TaxID=91930 RepID=A0AA38RLJ4_9PEZI|nr:hypothetical protein NKR19_g5133 [Coniochaeta hoffmannii]
MARHDVFNPAKASPTSIFPNDFSSKNALEKLAQAEAIEAAKKKKAADETEELARFRTAYPTLEAQKRALETQKSSLESQKTMLEAQKAALELQKTQKETDIATLQRQAGEMEKQLFQWRQDIDLMKIRLNQPTNRFNLEHSYHDKIVQVRLACWPHSALDFGGPHGWEYHDDFTWQWLRLRRVEPQNNDSAWTISHYSEDLYLGLSESDHKVECQRGRRLDGDFKGRQEWFIGLNNIKTGYMFVIAELPSSLNSAV